MYIDPPIENVEIGQIKKSLEIEVPIRTVSEANCFEHWRKKHERHKEQKRKLALALWPIKCQITTPCHIKLTRYAPKKLDKHDNLPMSLKYIVDGCCEILTGDYRPGKADEDEDKFCISYDQVLSKEYGVKIEFTF